MDLLDRLLGHDHWTTRQLLLRAQPLTAAQLRQPFDVGPGSLQATFNHMVRNLEVWTDLMRGRSVRPSAEAASVTELLARLEAAAADFASLAREVAAEGRWDADWLDVLDQPPARKTFGGAIAHVILHNMHHRAEALHMLSRLGVSDLPEGDVLSWEAQHSQRPGLGSV